MTDRPETIFATAATADQTDAGSGVIWWATHAPGGYALTVLDYQLDEVSAINADWISSLFARSAELVAEHRPVTHECFVRVEHPGLLDLIKRADVAFRDTKGSEKVNRSEFDTRPIRGYESAKWPATLDERTDSVRPLVNSGKVVKLETGLRRFGFRAIRTNHLVAQIRRHRPGDAASAGELLQAFVLGVLLGTTPRRMSYFEAMGRLLDRPETEKSTPSKGPFGGYISGKRPL